MHTSKKSHKHSFARRRKSVHCSGHEPSSPIVKAGERERMEHLKLEQESPSNLSPGLRAVAVLEASKAALTLLLGFGAFALIHKNLDDIAERLTETVRVNPEGKLSSLFLNLANRATD